jgi:hypothetical protein
MESEEGGRPPPKGKGDLHSPGSHKVLTISPHILRMRVG